MGQRGNAEPLGSRKKPPYWWVITLVVVLVVGIGLGWRAWAPSPGVGTSDSGRSPATVLPATVRRETRPTLDPALFVGKARLAHQVAREIPGVLDQLYCYCECDKHLGHKSLLSCYTDGHAAT
ncbi:MAG: hypothetical protein HYS14_08975 [Candidatus Rokubacteria bacterium]|nr:hypothetical protein [Candidatus Rokubacteria bacterium]